MSDKEFEKKLRKLFNRYCQMNMSLDSTVEERNRTVVSKELKAYDILCDVAKGIKR